MARRYTAPTIRPGDPLDPKPHNHAFREVERLGRLRTGGKLRSYQSRAGVTIAGEDDYDIDAQVTTNNGGGSYKCTQVFPAASGAWSTGAYTCTAYERNSFASVPVGAYVRLIWEEATQDFRFDSDSC